MSADNLPGNPYAESVRTSMASFSEPVADTLFGHTIIAGAMLAVAWEIRELRDSLCLSLDASSREVNQEARDL